MSKTGNDIFDATSQEQTLDVVSQFGAGNGGATPSLDAIEFRVLRPGAPVKRLRLTGNRYTLGSGEGCSIRLDDETLRPMHAVLLRDAQRILVRAYSVPLEVNGARSNESVLSIGDIVRMGQYRFELLSAPGEIPRADPNSIRLRPSAAQRDTTQHLQDKLTELSQQWHARHAECEARESRCDERESELHGRESELWSRAENLSRRETALVSQEAAAREIQETHEANQKELRRLRDREAAAEEQLQQKQIEIQRKNNELAERQQEMSRQQAQWQSREEEYALRANEAALDLEQSREQARTAGEALQRVRDEFTQLNHQLSDLHERHNELQERERHAQEEHERLRAELEVARNEAVEASARSEAERNETQAELDRVTQRLSEVSAELESTRRELADVRQQSEETQAELNERLEQNGSELQAAQERADQAQAAADASQQQVAQKQQDLEDVRRESASERQQADAQVQQLREQLVQLSEEKQTADALAEQGRTEIEGLRQQLAEIESRRSAADELVETGRSEIESLRQQLGAVESQRSQSEELVRGGQQEVATLRQQLADLEQEKQNIEDTAQRDLDELRQQHDSERSGRLGAESGAQQLREQISQLQKQVAEANEEASKLRGDYEGATASIRQLELLVDQTKNNQHSDHDSWAQEAEKLRQTIEDLSVQLATANAELGDLRIANESLRQELATVSDENNAVATGPTEEQWQALQDDLDNARNELETLRASHQDTIDRIRTEHEHAETELRDEIEQLRGEIADAQRAVERASASIDDVEDHYEQTADAEIAQEDGGQQIQQSWVPSEDSIVFSASHTLADSTAPSEPANQEDVSRGASDATVADELASEDSVWRTETEQPSTPSNHLSEYVDEPLASTDEEPHYRQETYHQEDFTPEMNTAADEADRSGIHWQDESPEYAVEDAIEDIEYNVGQAIDPIEPDAPPEESAAFDQKADPAIEPSADSTPWHEAAARIQTANESVEPNWESAPEVEQVTTDAQPTHEQEQPFDVDHYDQVNQYVTDPYPMEQPSAEDDAEPQNSEEAGPYATHQYSTEQYSVAEQQVVDQHTTIDQDIQEQHQHADPGEPYPSQSIDLEPAEDSVSFAEPWNQSVAPTHESATSEEAYQETGEDSQPWAESEHDASASELNPGIDDSVGSESVSEWPESQVEPHFEQNDQAHEPDEGTGLAQMLIQSLADSNSSTEDAATDNPEQSNLADPLADANLDSASWQDTSTDEVAPEVESHELDADYDQTSQWSQVRGELESELPEQSSNDDFGSEVEPTFVMEHDLDGQSGESSSAWNYADSGYAAEEESVESTSQPEPESSETDTVSVDQTVPAPVPGVAPTEGAMDEDSIEAYMSRLLQRVQGDAEPGDEASEEPSAQPVAETAPEVQEQVSAAVEQDAEQADAPIIPRSQAPEREHNMSAMRELANQSARNAVARSIRLQARNSQMNAAFKAGIGGVWMLVALVLGLMIPLSLVMKMIVFGAGFIVFAIFLNEAYGLWSDARRRLSLAEESSSGIGTQSVEELAGADGASPAAPRNGRTGCSDRSC